VISRFERLKLWLLEAPEIAMRIIDRLKSVFASEAEPASPAKLDARSVTGLSEALARVSPGERAWISMDEGRRLFSAMEEQYAFGEMDEQGKTNLAGFGLRNRSGYDIMPVEGRIYFTRSSG
jgi:hypothetical protein